MKNEKLLKMKDWDHVLMTFNDKRYDKSELPYICFYDLEKAIQKMPGGFTFLMTASGVAGFESWEEWEFKLDDKMLVFYFIDRIKWNKLISNEGRIRIYNIYVDAYNKLVDDDEARKVSFGAELGLLIDRVET